jgi:hypothetical protein
MLSFSLPFAGGGGIGMGGAGLPPLQLSSSATATLNNAGAQYGASNGDWAVNLAGSGVSLQSASGGINWLLVAAAVGAAWLITQR